MNVTSSRLLNVVLVTILLALLKKRMSLLRQRWFGKTKVATLESPSKA